VDRKVSKGTQARMERRALKVRLGHKVLLAQQVRKVRREMLVPQAQLGRKDQQVRRESKE